MQVQGKQFERMEIDAVDIQGVMGCAWMRRPDKGDGRSDVKTNMGARKLGMERDTKPPKRDK